MTATAISLNTVRQHGLHLAAHGRPDPHGYAELTRTAAHGHTPRDAVATATPIAAAVTTDPLVVLQRFLRPLMNEAAR